MSGHRHGAVVLVFGLLALPWTAKAQDHSGHHHPPPATRTGADHAGHDASPARQTVEPIATDAPREPIPELTAADRAAAFPELAQHMQHADEVHWKVLFNRFEMHDGAHGNGQAWEGTAWAGGDIHRLWLRSEGERASGGTESAHVELLYGRSVSAWWDVVAGVRHDALPRDRRSWAAFGVQGMAPYRFEVSATGYLGPSGRTAAAFEIEYDVLLTNRLILQPLFEATWHGKADPARGIGAGLSSTEAGLRLRYEVTRRFAPYLGYAWSRTHGATADMRAAHGESATDRRWVAGIRFWF